MKKIQYIICISALLFVSLPSIAQNRDRDRNSGRNGRNSNELREEFMARRNTYITEKTGLTAQEAAVFIPIENEWLRKKHEIEYECRLYEREIRNKQNKTDEDYNKILKCREDEIEKQYQLDKEYYAKIKKVLSAEKILKYQNAERAFRAEFFQNRR